jgi:hypothetical protein
MGRCRAPGACGPRSGRAGSGRPGPGWAAPRDKNARHAQPQGHGVVGAARDAGREGERGHRGEAARGAGPPGREIAGAWGHRGAGREAARAARGTQGGRAGEEGRGGGGEERVGEGEGSSPRGPNPAITVSKT